MIVEPDFLDHWKTRLLVDLLGGDEMAPLYVIRLWSHCQNRRKSRLANVSSKALKAICRFSGDADLLEAAMTEAGYLARDGEDLIASQWDEYNQKLTASWENGAKGGRPKKPNENPNETQQEPNENPAETKIGIGLTDKTRLDKTRLEKNLTSDVGVGVSDSEIVPSDKDKDEIIAKCKEVCDVVRVAEGSSQKNRDGSLIFKSVVLCRYVLYDEKPINSVLESLKKRISDRTIKNKRSYFHDAMRNQFAERGLNFNQQLKRVVEPEWASLKPKAEAQACS